MEELIKQVEEKVGQW